MKKTRKKLRQYYFSSKKAPLFSETISASPSMLRQNLMLERFIRVLMRAQPGVLRFTQSKHKSLKPLTVLDLQILLAIIPTGETSSNTLLTQTAQHELQLILTTLHDL